MTGGIRGLIVALGLGFVGAVFNFMYLNTLSQEVARIEFVGVKHGRTIEKGEPVSVDDLEIVPVPKSAAGNLAQFAVLADAKAGVIGRNVCRTVQGGSLLMSDDLKTPPLELNFSQTAGPNEKSRERAMWIPFDTRSFVPALINPGAEISLLLPKIAAGGRAALPTPAAPPAGDPAAEGQPTPTPVVAPSSIETEIVGPFRVLSVGNRLGTVEVMKASKLMQSNESLLTISVTVDAQGNLEPKAQRLWDLLRASNYQGAGVMLHPPARK